MKRTPVVAAAILAGAIPFQKEATEEECKDQSCVKEVTAPVPDQPHGIDEAINYEPVDYVVVMSSPITVERRTPKVLEWARQHGLEWRDATVEEVSFI
jgi:hypothetical protein